MRLSEKYLTRTQFPVTALFYAVYDPQPESSRRVTRLMQMFHEVLSDAPALTTPDPLH